MANGHGGARRGAGRPRKPPVLVAFGRHDDPLEFLRAVMRCDVIDVKLRVDVAKALLPFTHKKPGDVGKKDEQANTTKKAGAGRFAAAAPPLSIVR